MKTGSLGPLKPQLFTNYQRSTVNRLSRSSSTGNFNSNFTFMPNTRSTPYFNSIYTNSVIFKAKNLETLERDIRVINKEIKMRRQNEINSIYKAKMKYDFLKNYGSIYITAAQEPTNLEQGISETNNQENKNESISESDQGNLSRNLSKKDINPSNPSNSVLILNEENTQLLNNSFLRGEVKLNKTNDGNSSLTILPKEEEKASNNSVIFPTLVNIHKKGQILPGIDHIGNLKISLEIGELYGNKNSPIELRECISKISLLKLFQSSKKKRLIKISEKRANEVETCENNLISLEKAKELLKHGYDSSVFEYLRFLHARIDKEKAILKQNKTERTNLQADVAKLAKSLMQLQGEKEKYISYMNFLKCVKGKKIELSQEEKENELFFQEIFLKGKIVTLLNEVKDHLPPSEIADIIQFVEDFEPYKEKYSGLTTLEKDYSREDSMRKKLERKTTMVLKEKPANVAQRPGPSRSLSIKTLRRNNTLGKIDPKYFEIIFNSVEDFELVYTQISENGLLMLQQIDLIQKNIKDMTLEKEEMETQRKKQEEILSLNFDRKNKKYNDLVAKNRSLRKQLGELRRELRIKDKRKEGDEVSVSSTTSFNISKLSGSKGYPYAEMKEKLCEYIETSLKTGYEGVTREKLFTVIPSKEYEEILKLVFDDKNRNSAFGICLKLIKAFEIITYSIFAKDKIYNDDPVFRLEKEKIAKRKKADTKQKKALQKKLEMQRREEEKLAKLLRKKEKIYFLSNRRMAIIENKDAYAKRKSRGDVSENQNVTDSFGNFVEDLKDEDK